MSCNQQSEMVPFDNALNEMAWAVFAELQKHGPVNGAQSNNLKSCLVVGLEAWMREKAKETANA